MAEVRLAFDGECRGSCAGWGFVVWAGALRVGRGWGSGKTKLSRFRAALLALERGLEFVLDSPLAHRSVVAGSDASRATRAVLRPGRSGRGPTEDERLTDLIGQFEALRFDRTHTRANQEASALARLGLAQVELRQRAFEISDDAGFSEYLRDGAGRSAPRGEPEPLRLGTPDFFALPFDDRHLQEILDRIPFREREMIRLHYAPYGGEAYSFRQIGRIFRISGHRVRQLVDRGVGRLEWLAARFPAWR